MASFLVWVGWFIKHLLAREKEKKNLKKKIEYLNSLRAVANVYMSMSNLSDIKAIKRVFLLEISNGGDRPKPGSIVYAKAVEVKVDSESPKNRREQLLSKYEKIRLDENYIRIVLEAQASGEPYQFNVISHKECMLLDLYKTEAITYSEIYHVYTDPSTEKMFILSISTDLESEAFEDDLVRAIIRTEINYLRENFVQYRNT